MEEGVYRGKAGAWARHLFEFPPKPEAVMSLEFGIREDGKEPSEAEVRKPLHRSMRLDQA
jgi:hypothetical protein